MSPCAASPGEIRSTLLTLDLAVATQILMQLAVRDIGQVTDIQRPAGTGTWLDSGLLIPPRQCRRICLFLARQTRTPLGSHQAHKGVTGHWVVVCLGRIATAMRYAVSAGGP